MILLSNHCPHNAKHLLRLVATHMTSHKANFQGRVSKVIKSPSRFRRKNIRLALSDVNIIFMVAPIKVDALRAKLLVLWKPLGHWGLISLGRGYYEFSFSSVEYLRSVRPVSSWNLKPGVLRLFSWTADFSPLNQRHTTAQCWIRITGLAQEYWRPRIIFSIAGNIGTPICLDAATSKCTIDRNFGHYACVLVDIDLNSNLRSQIPVERENYAFFVGVKYENMPEFCNVCQNTGHSLTSCKTKNIAGVGMNQEYQDSRAKAASMGKTVVIRKVVSKYAPKQQVLDKGKGKVDASKEPCDNLAIPF